jgi:hypothetical protein
LKGPLIHQGSLYFSLFLQLLRKSLTSHFPLNPVGLGLQSTCPKMVNFHWAQFWGQGRQTFRLKMLSKQLCYINKSLCNNEIKVIPTPVMKLMRPITMSYCVGPWIYNMQRTTRLKGFQIGISYESLPTANMPMPLVWTNMP